MPRQSTLDTAYLKIAKEWSNLSQALRKKVGCIIVKKGAIISDGYNGTPAGFSNRCEDYIDTNHMLASRAYKLVTKTEVLHAEAKAIKKIAKSTQSSEGATMYVTASPCLECAKLIIQADISRVVYADLYKNEDGINLLKKANIIVHECKI